MEIMGIDVGGTGIKGFPVNIETGELLDDRFRLPTPEKARPNDVAETVASVVKHFNWNGPVVLVSQELSVLERFILPPISIRAGLGPTQRNYLAKQPAARYL